MTNPLLPQPNEALVSITWPSSIELTSAFTASIEFELTKRQADEASPPPIRIWRYSRDRLLTFLWPADQIELQLKDLLDNTRQTLGATIHTITPVTELDQDHLGLELDGTASIRFLFGRLWQSQGVQPGPIQVCRRISGRRNSLEFFWLPDHSMEEAIARCAALQVENPVTLANGERVPRFFTFL